MVNIKLPERNQPLFLVIPWLFIQAGLLLHFGIRTDFEAVKYINEAHTFINTGHLSTPNFWYYSTEIFLIVLSLKLKLGPASVVLLQIMINGLATICLFRFITTYAGKQTALITTLLLIVCIPFQQYNVALQTESLYHSFLILYAVTLLKIRQLNIKNSLLSLLLLLLLLVTRPSGLLLIPPTIVFVIAILNWKKQKLMKLAVVAILLLSGAGLLNKVMGSGGELNFMLPFETNMIICGVPGEHTGILKHADPNSVSGITYYITHNFSQFMHLAWQKTISFFGIYRGYFSPLHNALSMCFFFLLYLLSLGGLKHWKREERPILLFCLTTILVIWLGVVVTCDDWHNRFVVTLVPFFLLLSSKMLSYLINLHRSTRS